MNLTAVSLNTDLFFAEFERRLPDLKTGTLNFFFQDELLFGCDVKRLWRKNLREGVQAKYGYDPIGFLPHLFYDLGDFTPKLRMDVADVRVLGAVAVVETKRLPARADIDRVIDEHGVWLRPFCNYVYAMPPLASDMATVDRIAAAIADLSACPPGPPQDGDFHE